MRKFDLVLNNALVIDAQGQQYKTNIGIKDGIIEYLSEQELEGDMIRDMSQRVITPSFVNGHAHTAMNFLRGVAEDVSIKDWFNKYVWPYESQMNQQDAYVGAKLGFSELINHGVTVVADHYLFEEEVIRAAQELKLNLDMAPTIFSIQDVQERIETTLALSEKYKDDPKISISFGPHSAYTLTQEDLKKIIDSNTNLKFHIHVNETNEQAAEHFEKHQTTVIEFLDELGLFNHKVILAHNLGASDKELEMLHDKSILIPHCPETYLKLAMPIENMAKHEALNTTFGTDGVVSNDTMSILNQAKLFGLFGKWQQQDCTQYDALYLWKKLFNGHKFFDFNTGDIQEGKRADFIVWDLNQLNTFSYPNLISSIIYASNQQQIVEVYSTGIEIKKGIESLSIEKEYVQSRLNSFKEVKSELTF